MLYLSLPDVSGLIGGNQHKSRQVEMETEAECSPCEENLKRLKKVMEQQAARERAAKTAASEASDPP